MRKTLNIILIINILFTLFYIPEIKAVEEQIGYNTILLPVRVSPNTNSNNVWPLSLDESTRLEILGTVPTTVTYCSTVWYHVRFFSSYTGYVCGDNVITYNKSEFTKTSPTTPYEQELYNLGFTDPTYWPYLVKLHEKHPTWKFVPYTPTSVINPETTKYYTFDEILEAESEFLGRSLIQFKTRYYDGWKHEMSYDYGNDTFSTTYPGGGSSWYAASRATVAYHLDARNFLNDQAIFMFMTDGYSEGYHTLEGIQNMLNGTFMAGKPNLTAEDIARDKTYAEIILEAAQKTNINPYSLVSRIAQEIGPLTGRNTAVSGSYPGYEGYFNFYNIGASGEISQITINGLKYAYNKGWNSEYKAIIGGAEFIERNYFESGQNNKYFEKWDVMGTQYFTNQYMQNIESPLREGIKIRNTINSADLERAYTFKIPVYNDMPAYTNYEHPGNPNNYLQSLTAGTYLDNFDSERLEYTIYVPANIDHVNIGGSTITSSASVSGFGTVMLTGETTTHYVTVISGNNKQRIYRINIVKSTSVEATVTQILDSLGVKYNETYISGIGLNIMPSTIIEKVKKYNANAVTTIKDSNGTVKIAKLGTGDTITITSGNETKSYYVTIYGDLDGDGDITIVDLLRLQKIILGTSNISEVYKKAGDINKDGTVTILDLLKLQKHILGASLIEQ